MSSVEKPPLSQGVAYGIVLGMSSLFVPDFRANNALLGFGIVFALLMNGLTFFSRRYLSESSGMCLLSFFSHYILTEHRTLKCS